MCVCVDERQSADNSSKIALAISIDKLTKGCNLSKEYIYNCFFANIIIEICFRVVLELYHHLISRWVQQDVTYSRRLDGVRLEKHGDN
jgi:hypothetical protein